MPRSCVSAAGAFILLHPSHKLIQSLTGEAQQTCALELCVYIAVVIGFSRQSLTILLPGLLKC